LVFEVDDRAARAWHEAPSEKRREITNKVNIRIGKELFEYDKESFVQYLDQLRDKMAERGLTQELLDDMLKDEA